MFKRPLKVEVDAENVNVDHNVNVHPYTFRRLERLVSHTGATAAVVIGIAALAKTSSEIAIHIAKTKIQ